VPAKIALTVAIDVESADHPGAGNGRLPYPGVNRAPVPRNILRQTDIDRQQGPVCAHFSPEREVELPDVVGNAGQRCVRRSVPRPREISVAGPQNCAEAS